MRSVTIRLFDASTGRSSHELVSHDVSALVSHGTTLLTKLADDVVLDVFTDTLHANITAVDNTLSCTFSSDTADGNAPDVHYRLDGAEVWLRNVVHMLTK